MIEADAPLFRSMAQAGLRRVREAVQERHFVPGEAMLNEGETRSELFILQSGQALVVGRNWHGERFVLARLGPGECFGEISMLSGEPASATVEAQTAVEVWVLPHAEFVAIAAEYPELGRNLSTLLGERLRLSNERHLQAQLGRLVTLVAPGALDAPFRLAYHLAHSIAKHACESVAFVDFCGLAGRLAGDGQALRSLDNAVRERRLRGPVRSRRVEDCLQLITASDGMAPAGGQLLASLERLREQSRYVLLFLPGEPAAFAPLIEHADIALIVAQEDELPHMQGSLSSAPVPEAGQFGFVAMNGRDREPTARDVSRAQATLGGRCRVWTLIPQSDGALQRDGLPAGTPAGRSVDRLARKVAGFSIGLALGGGGAKGYAHIGVVRGLQRLGVPIDCVTGCSIGAPLAAGVAAGWSLEEIRGNLDSISDKAVRPNVPLVSILTSRSIRSGLRDLSQNRRFEDLDTPLGIVAVDIDTGEEVLFRSGVVWPAIVASMAYPGIYEPACIGGRHLVDGGVLNPVPVSACVALGADLVLGSNLGAQHRDGPPQPPARGSRRHLIIENIARSLEIMQSKIVEESCNRADISFEPFFGTPPGLLDFKRGRLFEDVGEAAVERALPKLRATLPWLT